LLPCVYHLMQVGHFPYPLLVDLTWHFIVMQWFYYPLLPYV
jgi:hypothetical protein